MYKITHQMKVWQGKFGLDYTDRNAISIKNLDNKYRKNFGVTRGELNKLFLGKLGRNMKILEVGSNMGNQLLMLQDMGFKNLYGIDTNRYSVEISRKKIKGVNIIWGSAFDIPFKDRYFDLVFTSGLLLHIHPKDINEIMREIHRCTKRYIWGFEPYNDRCLEVTYRRHRNFFWKTDFSKIYLRRFNDLTLVRQRLMKYLEGDNIDAMFLLRKMSV